MIDPAIQCALAQEFFAEVELEPSHYSEFLSEIASHPELRAAVCLGANLDVILSFTSEFREEETRLLERLDLFWQQSVTALQNVDEIYVRLEDKIEELQDAIAIDGSFNPCALVDVFSRADGSVDLDWIDDLAKLPLELSYLADELESSETDPSQQSLLQYVAKHSQLQVGGDFANWNLGDLVSAQQTGRFRARLLELAGNHEFGVDSDVRFQRAFAIGTLFGAEASRHVNIWCNGIAGGPRRLRPLTHRVVGRTLGTHHGGLETLLRSFSPFVNGDFALNTDLYKEVGPLTVKSCLEIYGPQVCGPDFSPEELGAEIELAFESFFRYLRLQASFDLPKFPYWTGPGVPEFGRSLYESPGLGAGLSSAAMKGGGCGDWWSFSDLEGVGKAQIRASLKEYEVQYGELMRLKILIEALYEGDWNTVLEFAIYAGLVVLLAILLPGAPLLLRQQIAEMTARTVVASIDSGEFEIDVLVGETKAKLKANIQDYAGSLGVDIEWGNVDIPVEIGDFDFDTISLDIDDLSIDDFPINVPSSLPGFECGLISISDLGFDHKLIVGGFIDATTKSSVAIYAQLKLILHGMKLTGLVYPVQKTEIGFYDLKVSPFREIINPSEHIISAIESAPYPQTSYQTEIGNPALRRWVALPWGAQVTMGGGSPPHAPKMEFEVEFELADGIYNQLNWSMPSSYASLLSAMKAAMRTELKGDWSNMMCVRNNFNLDLDRDQRAICWRLESSTQPPGPVPGILFPSYWVKLSDLDIDVDLCGNLI